MPVTNAPVARDRAVLPLYLQVKETLKAHILDGEYGVGDQLPSESQLRAAFGVSRVTVRQALQALHDEQLVDSIQGKGHFVRRAKAVQNLTRLQGLRESVAGAGLEVCSRVLGARECGAGNGVAEAFGIERGAQVVELRRVRYINRQPASLDISYFLPEVGARLMKEDLANRDVFDILENDFDIPLRAADIVIEVGRADDEVVRHLGMAPGDPVLRIERMTCTLDRTPLDFEYIFARGDSYQFRIRVPRL
jgi:GntR family transcriptional regulator